MRKRFVLLFGGWIAITSGTAAAPVEHITCPEGLYHIAPFTLTIDDGARALETPAVDPEFGTVQFTAKTVEWSFMRGWAVWHRDAHVLEWDATAQYDYSVAISHPGPNPRQWYAGKVHCEVK